MPRELDGFTLEGELEDPIGDLAHSPEHRLVHRYTDRLLLLVTDRCFRYCRFCFRRHWTGRGLSRFGAEERGRVESYLDQHPEIREVILSGGDALSLPPEDLIPLVQGIRAKGKLVRLSTRAASLAPQHITEELLQQLGIYGGVWWIHHVNHPDEIHEGFRAAVSLIARSGIAQVSQSVLLSDINDSPDVLISLFESLALMGIKPYYLFYTDLAAGTASWRVPLEKALKIWKDVKTKASRLVLPTFAVDLPGGRGKMEVETSLLRSGPEGWTFRAMDGGEVLYPRTDASLKSLRKT